LQNTHRLSKKERRSLRNSEFGVYNNLQLLDIIPLNQNQRKTFQAFNSGKNLLLHGYAGTGKSLISIYLSIKELEKGLYDKIVIYRSTVPSRDMGFLPGSIKEKIRIYEMPYHSIFQKLYNRADAYEMMKQKHLVEFESTAFVRGINLENCLVIVDEIQNMSWIEIYSIITRLGNNCRIICCGDLKQTDFVKEESCVNKFMKVIKTIDEFEVVDFDKDDIVRSKLVKQFIISCHELQY